MSTESTQNVLKLVLKVLIVYVLSFENVIFCLIKLNKLTNAIQIDFYKSIVFFLIYHGNNCLKINMIKEFLNLLFFLLLVLELLCILIKI